MDRLTVDQRTSKRPGRPRRALRALHRSGGIAGCIVTGLLTALVAASPAVGSGVGFAEFDVPTAQSTNGGNALVAGPDGAMWFSEGATAGEVGRITTDGVISQFPVAPWSTTIFSSAPGQPLWLSVAVIGPTSLLPTYYTATAAGLVSQTALAQALPSGVNTVMVAPDGDLWGTDGQTGVIYRMTTSGSVVQQFATGAPLDLDLYPPMPDGSVWFDEFVADQIGEITPQGQLLTFALPTDTSGYAPTAQNLTYGPDGNVWFLDIDNGRIGRVTPSGTFTMYGVPGGLGAGSSLTAGPDGALWFTGLAANTIGRITVNGTLTEYQIPGDATAPTSIATGPDGNLWIAATDSRETDGRELITRITPSDLVQIPWPRPSVNAGSVPQISGTAQVGVTLTATDAQFTGASALSRQWLRCTQPGAAPPSPDCTPIGGPTGTSYQVTPADLGDTLAYEDTAANPAGDTTVVDSATTAAVAPAVGSGVGFAEFSQRA